MTFLHPWAIEAGAAAVAAPILIHLLTRPRPRRIPLSTLRFVREAVQQKRSRNRLRDWIVLLLRTLAVALIAIAFARPMLGSKSIAGPAQAGKVARVVIVDQSLSMAAGSGGVTAFERARAAAATMLAYQPDARANLILAAAQPRAVFDQFSSNFDALRDSLGKATVRTEQLNIQAAINSAADMLAHATGPSDQKLELDIVSDFQRSNFAAVDFGPLPKQTTIHLESVATKTPLTNLAITRVVVPGRIEQGGHATAQIDVANYSPASRNVDVELSLGTAVYHASGLCPANVTTTLTTETLLPDAGWLTGNAKLVGVEDSLKQDDARPIAVNVQPPPTYALITRESSQPRATSSHFVELALVPIAPRDAKIGERVVRIDPSQVDRDALSAAAMIVIDHPGRLDPPVINLLAELMRRGRSILYISAEPTDAANLKLLADAAGSDLKLPVKFSPPAANQARRGLFLTEMRRGEAPFASFGEQLTAAIQPLRFGGGLNTHQLPGGLLDDVLASYSDRSAALVVSACGAGNLAILNADLNESNLPSSPVFVPLLTELTNRLLSNDRATDASPSGTPLAAYLPAEAGAAEGLRIVGPNPQSDSEDLGGLADETNLVVWHWPSAGQAGVYQVRRGDKTVYALATAAPASESNLETIDPSLLTGRLAGGRSIDFHAAGPDDSRQDTAWAWAIAICAMCMLAEIAVLKLFGT